ncbi:MAG: matrixin family metalloprotease [Micrococcales bacterium]|nr:matrixin family metalloprotease [Micrococcales bacterium]
MPESMMLRRIAIGTLAAMGVVLLPFRPVAAFTLRESDSGAEVRWHEGERAVRIDESLAHLGSASQARGAVVDALAAWAAVEGSPFVFEPEPGFRQGLGRGQRLDGVSDVSVVSEGWELDPSYLAITLVTYDPASGEIWDADVLLNGDSHELAVGELDGRFDAASVLTHEVGHLVGLGHSELAEATMYASSRPGETVKRSLAADDELGLQALYLGQPMDGGAGCRVSPARSGGAATWIAAGAVLWLVRRRRAR